MNSLLVRNPLALAIALASAPLMANGDASTIEEVQVIGHLVRGEQRALEIQQQANRVMSVVSATDMATLPDRNAAEALQRVPGVSIERDQGEGRFVAVRGLPSQWNSTSLNGDRIPTAEEETTSRATAFDFFPTEMIQRIEVSKTLTADLEGDAIGGSVNFVTRAAPDKETFHISLADSFNEKADDRSGYNASVLYGNRSEDGQFGFLVNGTAWKRDWATDNYEPRRGDDGLGIYRLELRDYTGVRETYGLNAAMEFAPSDEHKFTARALYGTLIDDETHYKHRYRFDKDRVEVQNIHNELITEMTGYQFGGEHLLNDSNRWDWTLASYTNEFKYGCIPNCDDNSYFVVRFDQKNVGYTGLENRGTGKKYAYNSIDGGTDAADAISNHLPDGFAMDPSKQVLSWVELYKVYVEEKDKIVAGFNFNSDFSDSLALKFGAKFREKERIATYADEFYEWNKAAGPAPTLADFQLIDQPGRNDYLDDLAIGKEYQQDFSKVVANKDLSAWYNANRQNLVLVESESALISNGAALGRNFTVEEQHAAAYGMATWQASDQWNLITGIRLEQTTTDVSGQVLVTDAATGKSHLQANNGKKDYLSVLPSAHVKYSVDDNTNLRFSITRSFTRPDFGSLNPGGTYSEADNEFFSGNSQLDPTYSWNYDLMAEHYFGDIGLLSGGIFYKDITDPIFQSSSIGEFNGTSGVNFFRPENGADAKLYGAEIALNKRFTFLSGLLQHTGIQTNVTVMDSSMTIAGRSDTVPVPRQADELYNVTFYYDDGRFSARIAVNQKGEYIEEHGESATFDNYYGDYTSVDFSTSLQITDQLMVFAELNNLTDEPLSYYIGSSDRPKQIEYYGLRGQAGIKFGF